MFGAEPNEHLLYEVAKMQQINRRARHRRGQEHARSSRGGGKKPWKQKGTGRARQGSIRASPLGRRRQGHGPQAPRLHLPAASQGPPRRPLRGPLAAGPGEAPWSSSTPSRSDVAKTQGRPSRSLTKRLKLKNALVVDEQGQRQAPPRRCATWPKFDVLPPEGLNLESVLRHKALVLTSRGQAQGARSSLEAR